MKLASVILLLATSEVIHAAAVPAPAKAVSTTSSTVNLKRAHHPKPPSTVEEDADCNCNENMFGAVEQIPLDDYKPTKKPTAIGKKPYDAPNRDVPHPKPSHKPTTTDSKKPVVKPMTHEPSPTDALPKAVTVTPKPIAPLPAAVNGPTADFTVWTTEQLTITTIQTNFIKRGDAADTPPPPANADPHINKKNDDIPVADPGTLAFGDEFPDPNVGGTDDVDSDDGEDGKTLNRRDVEYDDEETSTVYQEMLEQEMFDNDSNPSSSSATSQGSRIMRRDEEYDAEETSLAYQESLEAEMYEKNHSPDTKAKREDASINTWPADEDYDQVDSLAKRGSIISGASKLVSEWKTHTFKNIFRVRDLDAEIARITNEIEAQGGFIEERGAPPSAPAPPTPPTDNKEFSTCNTDETGEKSDCRMMRNDTSDLSTPAEPLIKRNTCHFADLNKSYDCLITLDYKGHKDVLFHCKWPFLAGGSPCTPTTGQNLTRRYEEFDQEHGGQTFDLTDDNDFIRVTQKRNVETDRPSS